MGEEVYSLTLVVAGAAGLIAAIVSPAVVRKIPFFTVVKLAIGGQVIAVVGFNLISAMPSNAFLLVAGSNIVWAFAITILNVSGMDYIARSFDENELGRVMSSMRTVVMVFVPVGALSSGLLIDTVGYGFPLMIWLGIVVLLAAVGVFGKTYFFESRS